MATRGPIYWGRRLRGAGREARRRLGSAEAARGVPPTPPESTGPEDDEPFIWLAVNRPVLFWFVALGDVVLLLGVVVPILLVVLLT